MMKTSAVPVVTSGAGEFSTQAKKDELISLPSASPITISSLVSSALAIATNALKVLFAPFHGKFVAHDGGNLALNVADTTGFVITLTPTPGQTGKVLAFTASAKTASGSDTSDFFDATPIKEAIDAILAPITPKFTAGALVQRITAALPAQASLYGWDVGIEVNQDTGKVNVLLSQFTDGIPGQLTAAASTATTKALVDLPIEEVAVSSPGPDTSLPFEGGAV